MSSKDWAAFRKRLTKQWALKYHKIGRWAARGVRGGGGSCSGRLWLLPVAATDF
jgi:hypothetical protein